MRIPVLLICAALFGCAPVKPGPEDTVKAIYAIAAQHVGRDGTPLTAIPMSDDLILKFNLANDEAQRRDEPFVDGDLALNCQDCSAPTELTTALSAPPANGRAVVEAHFKLDGEPRVVIWDMQDSPHGWRVDNIRAPDGYDLRETIRQELTPLPQSCTQERGAQAAAALVAQCLDVSPATHPPCNAENSCAMIQDEIARSCALLEAGKKPAFCAAAVAH